MVSLVTKCFLVKNLRCLCFVHVEIRIDPSVVKHNKAWEKELLSRHERDLFLGAFCGVADSGDVFFICTSCPSG